MKIRMSSAISSLVFFSFLVGDERVRAGSGAGVAAAPAARRRRRRAQAAMHTD